MESGPNPTWVVRLQDAGGAHEKETFSLCSNEAGVVCRACLEGAGTA